MRTKWAILVERRDQAREAFQKAQAELDYLERTPCINGGTGDYIYCSTCGKEFETEADFAKHYLVPDERYYNLGHCPNA